MASWGEGYGDGVSMELLQLLSLPTMEPSSPLSAPDLRSLMHRMHVRSEQFKDRVRSCVVSQHREFAHRISRASLAFVESEKISHDLELILHKFDVVLSKKGGIDGLQVDKEGTEAFRLFGELSELVGQTVKASREAKEKQKALVVVECISRLNEKLARATKYISEGEILKAAQDLLEAKSALGVSDGPEQEDAVEEVKPYAFLKQFWTSSFSKMSLSLGELFAKAVVFDANDSKLYIHSVLNGAEGMSPDATQLTTILAAMDKIGVLEAAFAKFADILLKTVIRSVLQDPLKADVCEEPGAMGNATLIWSVKSYSEDGVILAILYAKLLKVVIFLQQYLCCTDGSWTKQLGRFVWPRMADAIVSGYLSKAVPNEVSEVPYFQELATLTNEFEISLSKLNFIPKLQSGGDRLGKFSSDVELHFASKKKSRVLARTRRLLVRSDFNVFSKHKLDDTSKHTHVSEDAYATLLFQSESCAISQAAKQLIEIVHEVLEDTCAAASRISLELYHAARDALLLYAAIVPVKLAKELNSLSQEAIIHYNDCLYLSQEILGLSYQYREMLPAKLKGTFVFVDLVPLFQGMADDTLGQQLQIMESNLNQALDQGNGFQNTNKLQSYEMASLAIDQVVFLLEKVRMIWQPVMVHSSYVKALGSLMTSVFGRLASEILNLDDMDVKETEQLRRLIFSLEETLFPMLQSLVSDAPEKQNTVDGKSQSPLKQIGELVPTWCKLLRLAELLDMSLISITHAWESGNLVVCGFSSFEVQKLIKAVFSDTDLRKESLQRIAAKEIVRDGKGS